MDYSIREDYDLESCGLAKGKLRGQTVYCFYRNSYSGSSDLKTVSLYTLDEKWLNHPGRDRSKKYKVAAQSFKVNPDNPIGKELAKKELFDHPAQTLRFGGKHWDDWEGWVFLSRKMWNKEAKDYEEAKDFQDWLKKTINHLRTGAIHKVKERDRIDKECYTALLQFIKG